MTVIIKIKNPTKMVGAIFILEKLTEFIFFQFSVQGC